jgi:hypothetical protein
VIARKGERLGLTMRAFHMSTNPDLEGQLLKGDGKPKLVEEIEDALERRRPSNCVQRLHAVYAVVTTDFQRFGVNEGYIYEVEADDWHGHDVCWLKQLELAHLKARYSAHYLYIAGTWPVLTDAFVDDCCARYWKGESSTDPYWELLSETAEVKARLSSTMVKADSTKGGWRPPKEIEDGGPRPLSVP